MRIAEDGPRMLAQGYAWLPDRRRALRSRTVATRLAGRPTVALVGPQAARFFYDERYVRRAGAVPEPVVSTLFGHGGVHGLDGEEHRLRKSMFVGLLMAGYEPLVERAEQVWDDAAAGWARRDEIVLFDEAARVLTRAVHDWAAVPLAYGDLDATTRELLTLVDGFGTAGLSTHLRARLVRRRREADLASLLDRVRTGSTPAAPGSVLHAVAAHRGPDGELLEPRVAAVELLNVVRPTVAVAWFVAYSGHALLTWPRYRERLADGDAAFAEAWAHEVRRFYPFVPYLGGRTRGPVEHDGQQLPAGARVLFDVWGHNHDPALWAEPYAFRPERFLDRSIGEWELVPQGAGDPRTGHRCPGERITVALIAALAVRLARLPVEVPEQDLTVPLRRLPARVRSGVRLRVRPAA